MYNICILIYIYIHVYIYIMNIFCYITIDHHISKSSIQFSGYFYNKQPSEKSWHFGEIQRPRRGPSSCDGTPWCLSVRTQWISPRKSIRNRDEAEGIHRKWGIYRTANVKYLSSLNIKYVQWFHSSYPTQSSLSRCTIQGYLVWF